MLRSEIERVSLQRPVKPFGARQRQDRAVGVTVLAIEFACQTRSCKSPRLCCSCSGTNHLSIGHWIDCYLHSQCISRWLPASAGWSWVQGVLILRCLAGRRSFFSHGQLLNHSPSCGDSGSSGIRQQGLLDLPEFVLPFTFMGLGSS